MVKRQKAELAEKLEEFLRETTHPKLQLSDNREKKWLQRRQLQYHGKAQCPP